MNLAQRLENIRLATLLLYILGGIATVAAVALVLIVNNRMRQWGLEEAQAKDRILLDRNLATHTYFSHDLKPILFDLLEPFTTDDYFNPVWMSSTYAVRQIDEYFQSLSAADYYYKESAINARHPQNEADEYEREFIQALNANPALTYRSVVRTIDGQPYLVTLRRGEILEESCLRCHSTPDQAPSGLVETYGPDRSFGRREGETVSAISIRVPLTEAYAIADQFTWQVAGLLLILFLFLSGAQFGITRRLLLVPIDRLRDQALQISTSEEHLGSHIPLPPGRELRDLTAAFNTMSRHLRRQHDQLENRVRQRTAELTTTNQQLHRTASALQRERDKAQQYLDIAPAIILALDRDGYITLLNQAGGDILACDPAAVLDQSWFDVFLPDEKREEIRAIFAQLMSGEVEPFEYLEGEVVTGQGETKIIRWHNSLLEDEAGRIIGALSSGEDVTAQKRAAEQIEASLREKEALLAEIHHRVKNNLQIVSSLLDFQTEYIQDERAIAALHDCQHRIHAMAMVHEQLYQAPDLTRINMTSYIQALTDGLQASYWNQRCPAQLNLDVGQVSLTIKQAIPCGLIIHELISNALKHAFPPGWEEAPDREAQIVITFQPTDEIEDDVYQLTVHDNGVGLPPNFKFPNRDSLGLFLIEIFAQQIGGIVTWQNDNGNENDDENEKEDENEQGTTCQVTFSLKPED